jgi:hypothetical protein
MAIWENRELREAREAAQAADAAWKRHHRDCITCTRAKRERKLQDMCTPGWKAWADRRDTAAELNKQRELDKQPVPGQEALFDMEAQ